MSYNEFSNELIAVQRRPLFPLDDDALLWCDVIRMYEYNRPSCHFFEGVIDQLSSQGMSNDEIVEKLQSKDIRLGLAQFEDQVIELGRRFAKERLMS